jgi:hypothetical protein
VATHSQPKNYEHAEQGRSEPASRAPKGVRKDDNVRSKLAPGAMDARFADCQYLFSSRPAISNTANRRVRQVPQYNKSAAWLKSSSRYVDRVSTVPSR